MLYAGEGTAKSMMEISITDAKSGTSSVASRDHFEYNSSGNSSDRIQDILDDCTRNIEDLRMKILKTSVKCHMLEVDLATQFNPHIWHTFADAQESCKNCARDVEDLQSEAKKCIKEIKGSTSL